MICGFPKFPRIRSRFCLLILYSNIRLIVLYQFGIWCCWMFSYGSHICAWMLFRKRHNKFLFLDFLRLVWYLLCIGHYWLDIFRCVDIGVFLYWCMFLQHYLLGDCYFFVMRINYVFHVGHAALAYFNVVFIEQLVKFVVSREVLIN